MSSKPTAFGENPLTSHDATAGATPQQRERRAELWRPVDSFADYYEVSTRGRVRGVARVITDARGHRRRVPGRLLKLADTRGRSPHCTLSAPGRRQTYYPRAATGAARTNSGRENI